MPDLKWMGCAALCLALAACGGGAPATFPQPTATITATQDALIGDAVLLHGEAGGLIKDATVVYTWTVTAPSGASVTLQGDGTANPWFKPTESGQYSATLQLTEVFGTNTVKSDAATLAVIVGPADQPGPIEIAARMRVLAQGTAALQFPDASSPTITPGARGAGSVIAGSHLVDWLHPAFSYSGDIAQSGNVYPNTLFGANQAVSYGATQPSGNFLSIDFDTDAPEFEIFIKGTGFGSGIRVVVDGRLAAVDPLQYPADGGLYLTHVKFTSAVKRHIRLLGSTPFFGGVQLPAGYTIARHPQPARLRAMFLGDSITEGPAGQDSPTSFAPLTADLMGWQDAWVSGVGATGYLAAPTPKLTLRQRLALDVLNYKPQVLVITAGINDATFSDAEVQTEASLLFSDIQANLPDTLVFVSGPIGSTSRVRPGLNAAIKAAVGTRANFHWIPNIDDAWITGTGNAGSPAGDGNADLYISADTTHPTPAGIRYLAERTAQRLRTLLHL